MFMWNGRDFGDFGVQSNSLLFIKDTPEDSETAPNLAVNESNNRTSIPFKDSLHNPMLETPIVVKGKHWETFGCCKQKESYKRWVSHL